MHYYANLYFYLKLMILNMNFMMWFFMSFFFLFKNWENLIFLVMSFILSLMWVTFNLLKMHKNMKFLMNFLGFIIIIFFFSSNLWKVFMLYEMSLLPMAMMIMGLGLNPSRFSATFYMMIYTLLFSMPCMGILLFNWKMLSEVNINMSNYFFNIFLIFMLFFLFLVKTPVYLLHYWLPKAHVEASTLGSMVLAGGLLKMGSLGFLKMLKWLGMMLNNSFFLMSSCMGVLISLSQTDFKKMIAYMSITHMSLSLASLLTSHLTGLFSFFLTSMVHTVSSSMLFYFSGLNFSLSKTRILYLCHMSSFKLINTLFIITICINLGLPPFFSSLSEILTFSIIFFHSFLNFSLLAGLILLFLTLNLFVFNFFKMESFLILKNLNYILVLLMSFVMLLLWLLMIS